MSLKSVWELTKDTFSEWSEDKAPQLAAALAYYTMFSLGPLLLIVIAVAGLVFGREAIQGEIVEQVGGLIGKGSAKEIQTMIKSAQTTASGGIIGTIVGILLLIFGATGVFTQLQDALNTVWDVPPKQQDSGIMGTIKDRFLSFAMILGIGFLLLVSLVLSAGLAAFNRYLNNLVPGFTYVWLIVNFVVSFGIVTLLFAAMYKVLPDIEVAWSDVWLGAVVTALLFTIGKFLIGLYIGQSGVASAYGAAGSLVVILVWVYYSALILFLGAEFTQVYADKYGSLNRDIHRARG